MEFVKFVAKDAMHFWGFIIFLFITLNGIQNIISAYRR
jgi:hypothetical protein